MSATRETIPLGARVPIPLGAQLLTAVGLLLGLFVAAILLAVVLILQLTSDERRLSRHEVPYSTAVDEAALSAKGAANDARGFLISGNHTYVDEFNRRTTEAHAAFAAAVGAGTGPAEIRLAEQSRAVFEQWVAATRREFAAFAAGNQADARSASVGADRQIRKRYEALLDRASAAAARSIEANTTSFAGASRRSIAILLGCLLAVLLLGAAIAAWAIRTILKPVYALLRIFADT